MQKHRKTDKKICNCPKHLQSVATQEYNVLRPRRQLSAQKPNYNETLPLGRVAVAELYNLPRFMPAMPTAVRVPTKHGDVEREF
jgi:hypothetical protein